jgi:hypothetical protein
MYQKNIERASPGCILFLIDQSFSMTDGIAGTDKPKCDVLATAVNRFLMELITHCEKGEEEPRNYFDVGVIGYTTDPNGHPIVGPQLSGPLAGQDLVSIVDLYRNPLDIEVRHRDDGVGELIEMRLPIWYRNPGRDRMLGTPMNAAMQRCYQVAGDWCSRHPNSFPPIVIHLTDGESSDGNPEDTANGLKSLYTNDGNLLLFNCHLSDSGAEGKLFPVSEAELPNEYGRMLFRMSSLLPGRMLQLAAAKNIYAPAGSRGMAFNADATRMIMLISVGTVVTSSLR